jgi:pimeloyl-ACP methyl ester carboxylesterase
MAQFVHTPEFRGGSGAPLVLLNGGINTWTSWEPQLPILTERFDVLAPTNIGNAGAQPLPSEAEMPEGFVDAAEAAMDRAGFARAHLAGISLGGWMALELARRGRALSVYAFAPPGGWESERSLRRVQRFFAMVSRSSRYGKYGTPLVARIPAARRMLLRDTNAHGDRTPADVLVRLIREVAVSQVPGVIADIAFSPLGALPNPGVPVTIAWPENDRLLPYEYYGKAWRGAAPFAEWKTVPGVGHVPNYDEPELIAEQIIESTTAKATPPAAP